MFISLPSSFVLYSEQVRRLAVLRHGRIVAKKSGYERAALYEVASRDVVWDAVEFERGSAARIACSDQTGAGAAGILIGDDPPLAVRVDVRPGRLRLVC
jgi:hypothetical protein